MILGMILLLNVRSAYSQGQEDLLREAINLNPGSYRLDELIEKINKSNTVIISFNDIDIDSESIVQIKGNNPAIAEILNALKESLSVDYIIKGKYVILKYAPEKIRIKGIVKDGMNDEVLAGANILFKLSGTGTISRPDGTFEIEGNNIEDSLRVSFVGFKTSQIGLANSDVNNLVIMLEPEKSALEEVRVTSKLRKFYNLDLGRPLESINASAISQTNISNASDILNGRFAGVWATETSGLPGDHQRIYIRGISSLFGAVDPLYVVDGVSVPMVNLNTLGIADLNPHDIKNITILKDASSMALFGYQGGNGVVLIDTKEGTGQNSVSFYTKHGVEWFPKRYDLMDTKEFLSSLDLSKSKINAEIRDYYPEYSDTLTNTDWQDHIFKPGRIAEYQLSGSGNFLNTGFYLSGNYYNNEGVISKSSYSRYSFAANIAKKIFERLYLELGYRGSKQENRNNLDSYGGNRIIYEGINKSPLQLSTDESFYYLEGNSSRFAYRTYQQYAPLNNYEYIDSIIHFTDKQLDVTSHTFRGSLRFDVTDHLYLKASSDLSYRTYFYHTQISSRINPLAGRFEGEAATSLPINYIESEEHVDVMNVMLNAKWERKVRDHHFNLFAGVKNYMDLVYWSDSVSNTSGVLEGDNYLVTTTDEAYVRNSMSIHGPSGRVTRQIRSVLGNFNYSYHNRYFLSLAGNYENLLEGENIDIADFFPSVAVSWDVAQENFLAGIDILNQLKIYSGWGRAGNYPLNSLSNNMYSSLVSVQWKGVSDTGRYVQQLANKNLKQEIVDELNLGMSISLFRQNRLTLSMDVFRRINSNLIMLRDIPGYYGSGKMFYNIGEIETRGMEVTIDAFPVIKNDFSWYTKFNLTSYTQRMKKLEIDTSLRVINADDMLTPAFIINENRQLGDIYGYRYLGKWTEEGVDLIGNEVNIRGARFYKTDTSTRWLNENDLVALGNSIPDLVINWYNSFSLRQFNISMLWYAVLGVEKYNATRAATYIAGTNQEINKLINDSIAAIYDPVLNRPYISSPGSAFFYQSSYFVEDASFLRLKQLVITYNPPRLINNKVGMQVSLILENLLTFTSYSGYDPETSIYTDNNFSDSAIDKGAYPNPKSFAISLNFSF